MCFGGGGSGAVEAESRRAREDEERRQAEIRRGRDNINAVFDGGFTNPVAAGATLTPGQTYFREDGSEFRAPQASAGPAPSQASVSRQPVLNDRGKAINRFAVTPGAPQTSQAPTAPQTSQAPTAPEQLFGGRSDGFATDDFFARNRQAFKDYAMPQLDEQFGDASKELTFDLARSGLMNSSVRGEQSGRLQRLYDRGAQEITNEALSREQQQRGSIEDARANLIQMLQTTGDAQGATNQALSRAAMLSQPQPFSPVGQMFGDFTAGLGTQAAMERASSVSGGRFTPRYNTGLFGTPRDAVRYG